jgi:hypothetical protein
MDNRYLLPAAIYVFEGVAVGTWREPQSFLLQVCPLSRTLREFAPLKFLPIAITVEQLSQIILVDVLE